MENRHALVVVCHNCSSNFRLRSGVAALNKLEAAGITTAIGIDEAGIHDDRDMLREMGMVLRAHRVPGMDDEMPAPAQVFCMATSEALQPPLLPIASSARQTREDSESRRGISPYAGTIGVP